MSGRTGAAIASGALVLACLTGLGAWSTDSLAGPRTFPTQAALYLPEDGDATDVTVTFRGFRSDGTVEHAVGSSWEVVAAGVKPIHGAGGAEPLARWWRESVVSGEQGSLRVYGNTAAGIELRWLGFGPSFGFALEPGAVVLPATVVPGASWEVTGRMDSPNHPVGTAAATLTTSYRLVGSVDPATSSSPDGRPCHRVRVELSVADPHPDRVLPPLRETSEWCPGHGVVARTSSDVGFVPAEGRSPDRAGLRLVAPPNVLEHRAVAAVPVRFRRAAGPTDPQIRTGGLPSPDRTGGIVFPADDGRDLVGTGSDPDPGTVGVRWSAHPGGQVLSMTQVGTALLAATTQRRLVAYNGHGVRGWTANLPDVAAAAPVGFGTDGVAVLSADGTVTGRGLTDGALRWHLRIPGARLLAGSEGRVVVVDRAGRVTLLDPRGVVVARGQGPADGAAVLLLNERPVVWSPTWIAAVDLDGRPGWRVDRRVREVLPLAGPGVGEPATANLLVVHGGGVDALHADTGATRWQVPGSFRTAMAVVGGFVAAGDRTLVFGDTGGRILAGAVYPGWAPGRADQVAIRPDDHGLWLFARTPDGLVSGVQFVRMWRR